MGKMFSTLSLVDHRTGELYSDYKVHSQNGEMPQEFLNRMEKKWSGWEWDKYEILKVDGVPYEEFVAQVLETWMEGLNTKDPSAVRDETPRKPLPGWGETKRFDPFPDLHRDGFSASSGPGDAKEAGPLHPLQRFR